MMRERDRWPLGRAAVAAVCAVALLQIILGLAGLACAAFGVEWTRPTAVLDWQRAIVIIAFGALSAHLLLGARRDLRAEHLGALLLLLAVFYAHPPIRALANALPEPWARLVLAVRAAPIDAFTPALAWLFVRDFPRALEWRRVASFVRAMIGISAAVATALVAANVAIHIWGDRDALGWLDRTNSDSRYWSIVFGLLAPVIPFVIWRTRHAPHDERRRVRLFASGLAAAAILPIAIAVVPPLWEPARTFVHGPWASTFLIPLNLLMIISIAATTTYSVVVNRVLDVRTVLRMAAQYWLATAAVAALAGLPFVWILVLLYRDRGEPLASLLSANGLQIVALLAVGAAVLLARRYVMLAMDRLFFREPYDGERILAVLTTEARAAASTERLARSLMEQIEQALHPESIGVLTAPLQGDELVPVASALRSLPRASALAATLAQHAKPLAVELARSSGPLRALPDAERVWLGDAGASLLVPLLGSSGELDGILALGAKRSELPYSREDLSLLEAVSGAVGIGFENRRLRDSVSVARTAAVEARAAECAACGHVGDSAARDCPECGKPLSEAALPLQLFDKFQLERRVGAGGMGVVYRALDLALGRHVALKTLPHTSPEDADALRREARAMAAITHPNLALILGAETWQGTPILVLEYLARGTLEERIALGSLPFRDALEIAYSVALVLVRLHAAGLLHRDVKPSNVGFTEENTPKLLDFGLVRILDEVLPARLRASSLAYDETGFGGTPLYMSPEALAGGRPDPGFDLWGLATLTHEALTGRHPFERDSAAATLAAIRAGWTDELAARLPANAQPARELFETALAADRAHRPQTAGELAERFKKTAAVLPS